MQSPEDNEGVGLKTQLPEGISSSTEVKDIGVSGEMVSGLQEISDSSTEELDLYRVSRQFERQIRKLDPLFRLDDHDL